MKDAEKPHAPQKEQDHRFLGNKWILESKIEMGGAARDGLEKRLEVAGWSKNEIGNFPMVVSEAIANAVIHGNMGIKKGDYKGDEDTYREAISKKESDPETQKKKVRVELTLTADAATVVICDEGAGFKPEEIPDPLAEGLFETSGRGVLLMREICDRVEISETEGRVLLHKLRQGKPVG